MAYAKKKSEGEIEIWAGWICEGKRLDDKKRGKNSAVLRETIGAEGQGSVIGGWESCGHRQEAARTAHISFYWRGPVLVIDGEYENPEIIRSTVGGHG